MLINNNLIKMSVESTTKEEVIRELAALGVAEGRVADAEGYVQAVLKRESEYSTAVGFGVAIPHGKTNAVAEPVLAFGKVNKVDWAALDGEPVDFVFLIGVPQEESGNTHLQILAKLSRKLMKADFRNALHGAGTADEVMNILKENELL